MKEYTVAALLVFFLAAGTAGLTGAWRHRGLWAGMLVFGTMTVVADVALTGIGVYGYDVRFNAGLLVGRMPLEDLAYGLALYLVAVVVWTRGEPDK